MHVTAHHKLPELVEAFHHFFQVTLADTDDLKQIVYRLRYQVYCRELHFEREEDCPGGLESDDFDGRSLHCLIRHRNSNQYAGCVRLVRTDPANPESLLPFEKFCANSIHKDIVDPSSLDREKIGEISRLAVTADFRKRRGESQSPYGITKSPENSHPPNQRRFPSIPIGLYLAISAVGLLEGLDAVFAMMEPRLARHLRHFGIGFAQVGPVVDYHGERAPFYLTRDSLFESLRPEFRQLLDYLQEELEPAIKKQTQV